jgi:hypothetical protein
MNVSEQEKNPQKSQKSKNFCIGTYKKLKSQKKIKLVE